MLRLISRLATITIFSFLCALIYTNLAIADPGSTAMESLKGTGSTGSFSYEEDQRKKGAIGYGVNNQKHEGSKSKSYSHGSKGYSGHISGSESHKKSEGSKSKSYSHGKPGHGKSSHAYKGGHGYSDKKSEGSKSKSYSHGKPGHGRESSHTRVAMVTATRNPKAVNQNLIHTGNRVMGRVPMPTRVAMENLYGHKKRFPCTEATEDMARVLLNTLCIIKTNWV